MERVVELGRGPEETRKRKGAKAVISDGVSNGRGGVQQSSTERTRPLLKSQIIRPSMGRAFSRNSSTVKRRVVRC